MSDLEAFGIRLILLLQEARSPALDGVARGLSFLGDEPFYLLLLPLVYWTLDRRIGLRLTVLFLVSAWLNALLKEVVGLPRPSPFQVAVLLEETGGGVPSGHAQNAVVVWGYLAAALRSGLRSPGSGAEARKDPHPRRKDPHPRWAAVPGVGALVLVLGIGWSRLHLGVHFPHDVVVGWGVGGLLLAVALLVLHRAGKDSIGRSGGTGRGDGGGIPAAGFLCVATRFAPLVPGGMLLLYRGHAALPAAATLLGVASGALLTRRTFRFDAGGSLRSRLLRLALGLPVAAGIWLGLRGLPLLPEEVTRVLRYGLLGLWVVAGAPALFLRLGLAQQDLGGDGVEAAREQEPPP